MTIRNKHNCALYVAALCMLAHVTVHAANMDDLQEKQRQLNQYYIELERHNIGYTTKKIELETIETKLRRLKRNATTERRALDNMIKAQDQSPGVDFSDKIDSQRSEWRKSNKLFLSQKEYVRLLQDKVAEDKIQYKVTQQRIDNLQYSIKGIVQSMADTELNKQLRSMSQPKQIKVSSVETCSLTVTKDDCLDKARVRAERDAAERGSLVVVDAVTEVKNFNLTKDEVRSRVSARISNIQVFNKKYDLTADKTGWRVEYGITATVTPAIHNEMRNQLKQQIVSSLSANVKFRDVSTRDLPEYVELPPEDETDYTAYIAPAVPAEVIPERASRELRNENQREMQQIREVATSQARKTEEKEAQEELDSREISIMVF